MKSLPDIAYNELCRGVIALTDYNIILDLIDKSHGETISYNVMNFFNRNNHKGGDHWNIRQKGVVWEIDLTLFNPELFFEYKDIFPSCYYEIVCLKCSKYILEKIYNKYNKMPKDENGDVNLNYIEGELQMCYDDVTFELEEVLFIPIYTCKGDRINGESIKIPLIDIPKDFEIYGRKYT